ncbi:MAG: helix-turn-helix domain-containing protein [Deltaproteobacteria bacterium]|nr:helix-turn-helix domain-containing protein [Deltaproteobacteria bacterium]
MKAKTIRIKTLDEGLKDFSKAFKKAQNGKGGKTKSGIYFSSLEAVRKILTPERIRILRYLKQKQPGSIYELAKALNKDMKNVSQDLFYLSEVGLVELEETRANRKQVKPILLSDHVTLELVIT